eukprot:gb/GEZN01001405.1/.p1 GENE.gb/GEZN01001405.1/~~gb/GEZN01001405.1/.p1  ORF type:complete len:852 (+),score=121.46 gb/GEZN01001405.1/:260-2815(+)
MFESVREATSASQPALAALASAALDRPEPEINTNNSTATAAPAGGGGRMTRPERLVISRGSTVNNISPVSSVRQNVRSVTYSSSHSPVSSVRQMQAEDNYASDYFPEMLLAPVLSDSMASAAGGVPPSAPVGGGKTARSPARSPHSREQAFYAPYALCLASHYPIFPVMRQCLEEIYHSGVGRHIQVSQRSTDTCRNRAPNRKGHRRARTGSYSLNEVSSEGKRASDNESSFSAQTSCRLAPVEALVHYMMTELIVPEDSCALQFKFGGDTKITAQFSLTKDPSDPQWPLVTLFSHFTIPSILLLLSALLTEQKLLFLSESTTLLTTITQSLFQLLYPFRWFYAYVPVLVPSMLQALEIPQPYVLGIPSYLRDQVDESFLDDVVLVDVDTGQVEWEVPLELPMKERQTFSRRLKEALGYRNSRLDQLSELPLVPQPGEQAVQQSLRATSDFDIIIYRACLRLYAELLAGYRTYLFFILGVPFFNGEAFLQTKPDKQGSEFYKRLIVSRAFHVWVEEEGVSDAYHDCISALHPSKAIDNLLKEEARTVPVVRARPFLFIPPSSTPSPSSCSRSLLEIPHSFPMRSELLAYPLPTPQLARNPFSSRINKPLTLRSLKSPTEIEEQISGLMTKVFTAGEEGGQISAADLQFLQSILLEGEGRQSLASILRQPKERGAIAQFVSSSSFAPLVGVLLSLLRASERAKDFDAGAAVLDCGHVFFTHDKNTGSRRFVEAESAIRLHTFWRSEDFWASYLERTLGKEDDEVAEEDELEGDDVPPMEGGANSPGQTLQESLVQRLMVQGQKMMRYGVHFKEVNKLVEKYAALHNIDKESCSHLQQVFENVSAAMEIWHAA